MMLQLHAVVVATFMLFDSGSMFDVDDVRALVDFLFSFFSSLQKKQQHRHHNRRRMEEELCFVVHN